MDPYAALVSSASWSTVATDAVTVGVALAAVFVVIRGARMLLGFIGGGSIPPNPHNDDGP